MKRGKIAGWKIDKVASILTEGKAEEIEAIEAEFSKAYNEEVLKRTPKDVLSFHKKHPDRLREEGYHRFYSGRTNMVVYSELPICKGLEEEYDNPETDLGKSLIGFCERKANLIKERDRLINRIRCSIEGIGSYKKLKNEFPEAYDVLTLKVDNESDAVEGESPCDNIESLRAELNQDKKE